MILHAAQVGSSTGSPIVMLHSLALDSSVWASVVPLLTDDYRLVLVDLRGHGASPGGDDFTVDDMAADVLETLDALDLGRVSVVGMSLGGCVAQAVATLAPDRVDALVLVDTTAWYGEGAPDAWAERASKAREHGLASLADFQITRWFGEGFPEENQALCQRLLALFVANDIDSYVATCQALGAVDLRERVRAVAVPTGIVVGEFDGATPVSDAQDLRERIAGSTLTIIPGAKHLTPLEQPEVVADVVRQTIGRR